MRVQQALLISSLIIDAAKDWGGKNITNMGTINAVAIAAHKARHQSGGADAFAAGSLASGADPLASTHKTRHEPGGGDAMAVDQAVGTGSLRTLGAGATQAAPGNHTHTLVAEAQSGTHTTHTPDSYSAYGQLCTDDIIAGGDVDPFITKTDTFSALSLAVAGISAEVGSENASNLKMRLFMGGVQVAESGYINIGIGRAEVFGDRALSGSQMVKVTVHNYAGAACELVWCSRTAATVAMHPSLVIGSVKI